MTLAEVLRGPLGLTGTKIACNRGACSACTVWLDGTPVCSCMTFAVEVGPRTVTTIEGLAHGDQLHPVQEAFIAHDAMQCGFCTPGMAMSSAALLERNADPTAEDVERAISGHICRCGSYPHVVAATLAAAKARKAEPWPKTAQCAPKRFLSASSASASPRSRARSRPENRRRSRRMPSFPSSASRIRA